MMKLFIIKKINKIFLLHILLFVFFLKCKPEDTLKENNEILIQSIISARTVSTADRVLPSGTEVGFFAELPLVSGFYNNNLKYISNEGNMVADGQKLEFNPTNESTIIYGYSPYKNSGVFNNTVNFSIESDQNTKGIRSSDLLWGKATVTKNGGESLKFNHLMSLIKINLTSKAGNNLSGVKVELLNVYTNILLNIKTGGITLSSSLPSTIRAKEVANATYEAIIYPTTFSTETQFIRVTVGTINYVFSTPAKTFEQGKEYTFDIVVKDTTIVPLECAIIVKYNGLLLGNVLTIPANVTDKSLELLTDPITFISFKVRNASGESSWGNIDAPYSSTIDRIAHNQPFVNLHFNENFGAERTMVLEFYDTDKPNAVYKQVTVTQQAASNYLNLSTTSINADKFGNVYDIPYELSVSSNQLWSINNTTDWIHLQYLPNTMNQTALIMIDINNTGTSRTGVLQFMVGGVAIKTLQIKQSTTENASFTLKYELNIEINTFDNWLIHNRFNTKFYPNGVEIFNYYTSEFGDATAKITSNATYGFVVDAPASYNKMVVQNFKHDKFLTYRNYTGNAVTLQGVSVIVLANALLHPFYYPFKIDIAIPAGVKRNQKVVFNMVITDDIPNHQLWYPVPATTYQIVDQ